MLFILIGLAPFLIRKRILAQITANNIPVKSFMLQSLLSDFTITEWANFLVHTGVIKYMVQRDFNPQNILYVVDARQKEHFEQVFEVAHLAGYVDDSISLEHIPFGTVNGDDGKPFKTRNGGVMNLKDLITLAIQKAKQNIPTGINEEEAEIQAYQIAIGALKFQDLKNGRTSDYIFDTENFTKSEGKTGAYIQYAIARINSILDKSNITEKELIAANIKITHPLERTILLLLKQQNEALQIALIAQLGGVSDYGSETYGFDRNKGRSSCKKRSSRM